MKYRNLYIAASSQHVGKTTSTLGLTSTFIQKGLNVGYCKPVGQKFLKFQDLSVDKDTLLFADLINFDIKFRDWSLMGRDVLHSFSRKFHASKHHAP